MSTTAHQARRIDGKELAAAVRMKVAANVAALRLSHGVTPGLAVVLVGDDPASDVYVRSKAKQTVAVGMASFAHRLDASVSEAELRALVERLNRDDRVHGILVQLPLPGHIDSDAIIDAIDPGKDVDGFHPSSVAALAMGRTGTVPCTPLGCLMLLRDLHGDLTGRHAVVIGRSNIVGKPMAQLLLRSHCSVTVLHSRSRDLPEICRTGDIVVAAVGIPGLVKRPWIKPGATVIDVGINRVRGEDGTARLVGDVDFPSVLEVAGAITPVPGGVGPMTIACLLANTLNACRRGRGLPDTVDLTP